jgi:aryl-alcohol dehydrogenase-like predicted oxidoreductase
MTMIQLGSSGLTVSDICLGTMTFGNQTPEADAHRQMDMAREAGVTFWDCAEMYPVNPVSAEAAGRSEALIGSWLAARGGRDRLQLASKVSGRGQMAVRQGAAITGETLAAAVEGSLRRMRTDCIDLYQLHWPNRKAYHFREIWTFDPAGQDRAAVTAHMLDVLQAADRLIRAGKIRAIALSNESAWGAAQWLALAEAQGLPRMASVQNEYSLLCRQFDSDWAEFSVMEDMPLLAFSPLAAGLLTGKYQGDATPPGSRRALNPRLSGRMTGRALDAVAAYHALAAAQGLDPVQMAIAFCRSRPFRTIPILGATTADQLARALGGKDLVLSAEALRGIDRVHRAHPQPY